MLGALRKRGMSETLIFCYNSADFDKSQALLMTSTSALFIHSEHFKSALLQNTHFVILSIRHNDSTNLDAYLPYITLLVIITSLIPIYTLEMGFYYVNQANFVSYI